MVVIQKVCFGIWDGEADVLFGKGEGEEVENKATSLLDSSGPEENLSRERE